LLVLSVLSVSFLAAAAGLLAHRLGRPWIAGALVALLPGAVICVFAPGSADAFGCALAVFGFAWWLEGRRRGAIALFCLAGLSRETLLLFPLTLAAWELYQHRSRLARLLTIPLAVYVGWIAIVYARVGALPTGASSGRLGLPFVGLSEAMVHWSPRSQEVALSIAVLAVAAAVRIPRPVVRVMITVQVALASMLGELVWASWRDFSRVLLPLAVLGAIAVWPATTPVTQPADAAEAELDDALPADFTEAAMWASAESCAPIAAPTA
jgi:hypothetical protein